MNRNLRWYSALTALLVLFTAFGLSAQEQDPSSPGGITTARGFSADKAFHMGDFDNINVFNGNLIVNIPVGLTFPVAGNLSYGVSLTYNSKIWPGKERTFNQYQQEFWRAKPEKVSNAGFGWLLSMGRLYLKCDLPVNQCLPFPQMAGLTTYESPDGALHSFYPTLHESGDGSSPAGVVGYTRDGMYLRLRTISGGYEVDFPDGSVRKFMIISGTYNTQLTEIRDAFGNKVTFTYTGADWTFGDTRTGRSPSSRTQSVTTVNTGSTQINFTNILSKVSFTAQGGRTLDYKFIYNNGAVDEQGHPILLTDVMRGCVEMDSVPTPHWPSDNGIISVPLLTSVEVRDAAASSTAAPLQKYTFTYADSSTCAASALTKMTLPTGSAITWDYSTYNMPTSACGEGDPDRVMGVSKRTMWKTTCTDPNNSSCVQSGAWTYTTALLNNYPGSQVNCNDVNFPPNMVTATPDEMVNTVTGPDGHKTLHHFSVWNARPDSPDASRRDEYGLPFGRSQVQVGSKNRYISVEQQDCTSGCTTTRASYVTYERDDPTSYMYASACNRRVSGSRTRFLDDVTSGVVRYKDTDFSSFDGLGHYRTTTTTGNFTTAGDKRVETTNFNPSSGTYPGAFVLPSSWLIETFNEQTAEENSAAAKKTFTWDSTTGALSTVRTLKNSAAAASSIATDSHDLLAVYCRDAYGNVTAEKYFGGDAGSVSLQTCTSTPAFSSGEYQINHSYSAFGPREKSWFSNLATTQYFIDQTVSDVSALPSSSRDVSGLQTTYAYDILGRLTSVTPPGAAWAEYAYLLPGETYDSTTVSLPTVFLNIRALGSATSGTPLRQQKYEFDTLGRMIRQSHLTPDGTWSASETSYDGLGRKVWSSEPESTGTSAPTGSLTAALKTTYTYDSFGRPKVITAADSSTTTFTYAGLQYSDRTSSVATGPTTNTSVTTKYNYDAFGRLVHVAEPSGPSTSTAPAGGNVDTNYGYDVGGRLSSVEMIGAEGVAQNRIFDYDRRGFLLWETHPESGMSTYTYDARGNVLTRRQAAASTQFDLNYTYDSGGRLRKVDGRNPNYDAASTDPDKLMQFRPVKEFTYGDTNDTSASPVNYRQGKLATAVRYNYVAAGQTYYSGSIYTSIVRVTETYQYADAAGRKTHRTMAIDDTDSLSGGSWMNSQTVDQDVAYNDLDLPSVVKYPTCINCGLPAYNPERNLSPTYAQGQITGVPDFVSSISYWPNGMRNQLVHANNIADTQLVDGQTADQKASLARPKSISSGLYDACVAPVITSQPQGGQITTGTPTVTMTVIVAAGSNATYQWYIKDGINSYEITGATSASLTVNPTVTTYYFVAVKNACRTLNSNTVRVSVNECVAPTVTSWLTVNADRTVTLNAKGNGTEPFTYTWHLASDNSVIGNSAVVTVGPITATTSYYAKVANPCSGSPATGQTLSAVIPLTMPTGLVATKTGTSTIRITWPASTGAVRYHLERRSAGTWQEVTGTEQTATLFDDAGLALNTTYAYRVWATASTNQYDLSTKSNYSNVDVATTMTFTTVSSGTTVQAAHLDQLLQAVNSVRAAAGWSAVTWSNILASNQPLPSPGALIVPAHILATRARINEALQALGVAAGGYTDPDPALKIIKAVHITEVQQRAQ